MVLYTYYKKVKKKNKDYKSYLDVEIKQELYFGLQIQKISSNANVRHKVALI